jgi:hypothetical protein
MDFRTGKSDLGIEDIFSRQPGSDQGRMPANSAHAQKYDAFLKKNTKETELSKGSWKNLLLVLSFVPLSLWMWGIIALVTQNANPLLSIIFGVAGFVMLIPALLIKDQ